MFLDESTETTMSTPDQIELRTDVSAPFLVESVNRWHYTSKSTSKLHVGETGLIKLVLCSHHLLVTSPFFNLKSVPTSLKWKRLIL